ncbi:MAG: DNA-processing protein DprA [Lachnospiraceae bacterium]|nr:DNA-processing protein DprA [Lachnospiraceae bacterium]
MKIEKRLHFIPFVSPEYPQRLKNIPDPPFGLYVSGELPRENIPSVAIIGARACSEYGKSVAAYFGRRLGAAGVQIISGMARGIDGIAQRGALEGGGRTFAVLGCGADVCYPSENIDLYRTIPGAGGVISEYMPGTQAKSSLFPARNRIISGLADLLLVIEARKRSGTYITVTQALEQGKEVYAVPGRITDALSDGCNYLLTQGAGIATSVETVMEALANCTCTHKEIKQYSVQNLGKEDLEAEGVYNLQEKTVWDNIISCLDITPVCLDELLQKVRKLHEMTISELMLELTKMQVEGIVIGDGNYYRKRSTL